MNQQETKQLLYAAYQIYRTLVKEDTDVRMQVSIYNAVLYRYSYEECCMALLEHISTSKWPPAPSELLEKVEAICAERDNTICDAMGQKISGKKFKNAVVSEYVKNGQLRLDNNDIIGLGGYER